MSTATETDAQWQRDGASISISMIRLITLMYVKYTLENISTLLHDKTLRNGRMRNMEKSKALENALYELADALDNPALEWDSEYDDIDSALIGYAKKEIERLKKELKDATRSI